ncbi:IS110 family transposase [Orientia tsutsugamushi]|nr:transposase family protein [Orientia tsutsugamushi str. TA763]KJV74943.1 transposase family protein [Orientia tsutsugamushi str. TA763]SPP23777.1 IS110 family transposase [Orientia tsutsugamushi]
MTIIVGIAVSKEIFDAAVLINNKVQIKKFNNNVDGFNKLVTHLKSRGDNHGLCLYGSSRDLLKRLSTISIRLYS